MVIQSISIIGVIQLKCYIIIRFECVRVFLAKYRNVHCLVHSIQKRSSCFHRNLAQFFALSFSIGLLLPIVIRVCVCLCVCACAHASSNNDGVSSTPAYVPACLQRTTLCFFISLFFPSVYMSARHSGIGRLCSIYIPLYYTFFPTLPKKFVRKAFT